MGGVYEVMADDRIGSIEGGGQIPRPQTLTVGNSKSTEFSGVISGSTGGLIKVGSGQLELSGSNVYGGTTSVQAGELKVTGSAPTVAVCATGASSNICVQSTQTQVPLTTSGDTTDTTSSTTSGDTTDTTSSTSGDDRYDVEHHVG